MKVRWTMRGASALERPELAAVVASLATRYAQLRFGPAARHDDIVSFERAVRQLAV